MNSQSNKVSDHTDAQRINVSNLRGRIVANERATVVNNERLTNYIRDEGGDYGTYKILSNFSQGSIF